MAMPPYVYSPLGNKDQSILDEDYKFIDSYNIRIIELEPADSLDVDLRCNVKHIDLELDYDFSALSYVWGAGGSSDRLICGTSELKITSSLSQALRRLRKRDEVLRLWVDAVCINQTDLKEKSQQVQRMGQIYNYARSVLVWLEGDGPDREDMDKCINFFWGLSSSKHESAVTTERANRSVKEELLRFFGEEKLDAVHKFLALPWFTRRWVIQEGLVGKAHFYCGSLDITTHALDHAIFVLKKSSYAMNQAVLKHIQSLEWQRSHFEHTSSYSGSSILDLLVRFSTMSCTVDHDRIYAYLGLANDVRSPFANLSPKDRDAGLFNPSQLNTFESKNADSRAKRLAVEINYEDDVKQVFADFAERMLGHKDHLELLHCAGAFRPRISSMSPLYQSWSPNWRLPMRFEPFLSVPWFKAGISGKKKKPFLNYPWCKVEGFVFDKVVGCISLTPNRRPEATSPLQYMFRAGDICSSMPMYARYITGERLWQAMALTFIADHGASHEMKRHYESETSMVNGKLVKRNASERDMHAFLDWWARYDDGLIPPEDPTTDEFGFVQVEESSEAEFSDTSKVASSDGTAVTDMNDSAPAEMAMEAEQREACKPGHPPDSSSSSRDMAEPIVQQEPPSILSSESGASRPGDVEAQGEELALEVTTSVPTSHIEESVKTVEAQLELMTVDESKTHNETPYLAPAAAQRPTQWAENDPYAELLRRHSKSLHRHKIIGLFLKPSATAQEWGPTSYETQSGWHSRVDEELEPYELAWMNKESRKSAMREGNPNDGTYGDVDEESDSDPERPYDCEWRHQNGGLVWFDGHDRNEERYMELAHKTLRGRHLFVTDKGYFGLGPDDMCKGDTVAILHGGRTPFILRERGDGSSWTLLGDCYVHGIMGGEALQMERNPDRKFVLM
ncbi:heterokaryon incompatibility protein-domain-containing protein [Stachybotrys elegans]|uniref:Heterokaryon incompatibility protein-domain-containing protein n=1 Tax=Stachybotrys elegans TaxID=80388 RepID=A0A8K0SWQ4_9HYPO|nr:heterokaryon incompatibility protein-domain-containing protein [Stachybotrys elegans]